jgi:hypothetical protein
MPRSLDDPDTIGPVVLERGIHGIRSELTPEPRVQTIEGDHYSFF